MGDRDNQAVGTGIALGSGVGATTSIIATGDVTQGLIYGLGAGIILGSLLSSVAPRLIETDRPALALVAGGLFLGIAVGGAVGTVAAWGADAALTAGFQAGGAGGAVLGVFIGGTLAVSEPDDFEADT